MTDGAQEHAAEQGEGEQRSPEQIRAEIEQTREELGETVEALAEKTDVKTQAKNRFAAIKETSQKKRTEFAAKAREATPDSASAGSQQLYATVQEKPLPFATAGAFLAGLVLGRLTARR